MKRLKFPLLGVLMLGLLALITMTVIKIFLELKTYIIYQQIEHNNVNKSQLYEAQRRFASPDMNELLGQYYHLEARQSKQLVLKSIYLRLSLHYFSQALQQRPSSAYLWINIALLKAQLGEFDARFEQALQSAYNLGSNLASVYTKITDMGFSLWGRLPKNSRQVVIANIRTQLKYNQDKLLILAQAYQRMDVICQFNQQYCN